MYERNIEPGERLVEMGVLTGSIIIINRTSMCQHKRQSALRRWLQSASLERWAALRTMPAPRNRAGAARCQSSLENSSLAEPHLPAARPRRFGQKTGGGETTASKAAGPTQLEGNATSERSMTPPRYTRCRTPSDGPPLSLKETRTEPVVVILSYYK